MKSKADAVLNSRYQPDTEIVLNSYFDGKNDKNSSIHLLTKLQLEIDHSNEGVLIYPQRIIQNWKCIKDDLEKRIEKILGLITSLSPTESVEETKKFFTENHEFIKIARWQWLLANPGVLLELTIIPNNLEKGFVQWLDQYHIYPGDKVICRHTVSNKGRMRLKAIGFMVPYDHWDKSYVVDALKLAAQLLQKKKDIKALFTEDSWLYDPRIHEKASDGEPYVSFSFFNDRILTGHIYFRGIAIDNDEFKKHYYFATRNPRRKTLAEKGEFVPRVYGAIYPREELLTNLNQL